MARGNGRDDVKVRCAEFCDPRNEIASARALVTRIAALQSLALCMRASRNASGSIRMEFHAVKNPRRSLAPSLGIFSPPWLFSLSLGGDRRNLVLTLGSPSILFRRDQISTGMLSSIVKILFFILKICEKDYKLKHVNFLLIFVDT